MPRAPLGRLPNAPLAYVIAQVRFDAILAMEKLLPEVQAALRPDFPRFQALQGLTVVVGPAGPVQAQSPTALRWDMATENNRRGVILQQTSITYHTTDYSTYEEFAKELSEVLARAQDTIPDMFVRRVGLRYVDLILPNLGESPGQYVETPLRCDPGPLPGVKTHNGVTALLCEMERGQLHVKYYITGKNTPPGTSLVPPDLEPFPLALPDIMKRAQAHGHPVGMLDTDRFIDNFDQRYSSNALSEQFNQLHGDISLAFHQFTSDHARKIWGQE